LINNKYLLKFNLCQSLKSLDMPLWCGIYRIYAGYAQGMQNNFDGVNLKDATGTVVRVV